MLDEFETDLSSARRISSGSKISLILDPFDLNQVRYEVPAFGITVDFQARWIDERKPVQRNGKIIQAPLGLGAILIRYELRAALKEALGGEAEETEIEAMVRDCHALIIAYILAYRARYGASGDQPHIYEAARLEPFPKTRSVGCDAVSELQAVEVF